MKANINESYLRSFFGISADKEGDAEAAEVISRLERLQYTDGQNIITIDDEPDGMYFLESGTATVLDRGGEQLNIMHEGQCFGEYAVLSGERRMSTVRSLGRTVVFRLGNDDVMEILSRHPKVYGEFMKKVYDQVSGKHTQLLTLSRMKRGVLQAPENDTPLTHKKLLIQYGALAVIFVLCYFLIPGYINIPLFIPPLLLMTAYVIYTRRTVESLVVSGMLAAVLLFRNGLSVSYTDSLMKTMENEGNVFTVLVMALMGGMVELTEASGAVTAFKKLADSRLHEKRKARLALIGVMAVTAIDDCLNMLCASTSLRTVNDEMRIPREDSSLMLSMLPTCLSSFLPFSLWGIFVIANISTVPGVDSFSLLCKAIPLNFFAILTVLLMLAFCFGKLPRSGQLKSAEKRVDEGGKLWPEGSENYLVTEDPRIWGKIRNLLLPVVVLGVTSAVMRSIFSGSFVADSACGLIATLIFMFFFYCWQKLMSPAQFIDRLVTGIQNMTLPIILYLLSMCFSSLLEQEDMGEFLNNTVTGLSSVSKLMPAVMFLVFTLLTVALGSSWAMYAIAFPLGLRFAIVLGLNMPLCAGAICAAGIAGEKCCIFTSDSLSVGIAAGCDPDAVLKARMPYSIVISLLTLLAYAAAGFLV